MEAGTGSLLTKKAQTSQQILAAIWDSSPDAWVLSDAAGIVLDANPAYLEFYGLTREETVGSLFTAIFPKDARAEALAQYREAFTSSPPRDTFETVISHGETNRVVESTISFLMENGRRIAMLSCLRDVTKHKQRQEELTRRSRYEQALAQCSQILLENPNDDAQEQKLLNTALEHLRQAVQASRAYIFKNIQVPHNGLCMSIIAEACASGVWPQIDSDANKQMPWKNMPPIMRQSLETGQPFGGPVTQAFATTPEWIEIFKNQRNPLLSFHTIPVHFEDHWWGFIGFDDVVRERQWQNEEIKLLQTASEIIASTLQRWLASKILEVRVKERTTALRETNENLQSQIRQRLQAEADLAHRLKIEQVLTTLSGRLLQPGDVVELLQDTLHDLGQLVQARRILLIHLDPANGPLDLPVVQWQDPDLTALPPDLPMQLIDTFPWLWQQVLQGESVMWHTGIELPETAVSDRQTLAEWDIEALALIPMMSEGTLTAVLCCSNFGLKDQAQADNLRILQLGANLIENMLRRETVLATLERRVADRTKDLTALFDFTMQTSQAETVSEMLEPAIRHIADTTHCQAICVHLLASENQALTLTAQLGLPDSALAPLREIPASPAVLALLKFTEKQALLAEQPTMPGILPDMFKLPEFQTYLGSQLRVRGRPIGFLSAYRVEKRPFNLNEVSLLVILAEQLGVLVENHHLQQQAEAMAIVGERQRLARELHDSITQSLFSQTLFARSARYALEDDDVAKLRDSLHQLELGSMATLKEMRLLLFQMKPLALESLSLQEAIEQRFDDVERRLGINAVCHIPNQPHFPDEVMSELYRVIMEALNNSLKHAQAEEVGVKLQMEETLATLTISDDGIGFDLNQMNPGMGLGYMCERISHIQGHIEMESSSGNGTHILIQIPITATKERGTDE